MLLGRDQRAHVCVGIERGARSPELGGLAHPFDDIVEHALVRVEAAAGDADLAGIEEDCLRNARRGLGHIDVRHHHHRALAAQFEGDVLERVGGVAVDQLADLGRAGEGHLVDIGVLDQPVTAGVAIAGDDVDHARRDAGFVNQVGQAQGGEAGLLGRLEDGGAARCQHRGNLEAGHQQREVPRHDLRAHADRLLQRV